MNRMPAVRRRLVGAALRRYRAELGLPLEEAARVPECDRSKISRIETGARGIRPRELHDLLTEYGVGRPEQQVLTVIANPRIAWGWWQDYADVLTPDRRDYLVLEAAASRILCYHTGRVPGLLRTEAYARAVVKASRRTPAQDERRVAAAMARQKAVMSAKQPGINVVIAEAALGGQAAEVMRAQLASLSRLAANSPKTTIQVLPSESAARAAGAGELTILTFAETPGLGIVRVAGIVSGIYLHDPDDVTSHVSAFTRIRRAALSDQDSAVLLRRMATGRSG